MPTNTFTGQDAAVDWAASHRNLGLRLFGAPPLRSRPAADVERSHSISIRLEAASDASEIVEVSSISFVYEAAPRTGLRGVSCTDRPHADAFLSRLVFDGGPKEAVRDSIDELSTSFSPFTPTLPQVFEPLDDYVGVELLGELINFCRELPASGSRVVSLLSAKSLELLSGLASASSVSMGLKLRSSLLKLRLHPRQVLPEVELPQNFALCVADGHGNAASVDVHPQHVWAFSLQWFILSHNGEEPEVLAHDHGTNLPAISEVSLEPSPGSILGNRQTYSFRIDANAQGRVATPCGFEAEKAPVEPHDHVIDMGGCFTDAPSITASFLYKLGRDAEPLTMLTVGQAVELRVAFGLLELDQPKALLNHLEKGEIGFPEFCQLALGHLERVQDETFLHEYRVRFDLSYSSHFGGGGSPKVIFKPSKWPPNVTDCLAEPIFGHFFAPLPKQHRKYSQILH